MNTNLKVFASISGILFILFLGGFYIFGLNHVGINEVGVAYNSSNGQITVQSNAGWYITSPMTKVVNFSTLPQRVTLPTVANLIEVKIVKIRAEKVVDFVKLQGFSYSISGNLNNILMGYAFSGKSYDFLEIVQDSTPAQNK